MKFLDVPPRRRPQHLLAALTLMVALFASTHALAQEPPEPIWLTAAEVGVGPIDEDLFLHLTPRLTYLRPVTQAICADESDQSCQTLFETTLQLPLRLRIADREPVQDEVLRREDWNDVSDFFRIIRRVEYGTSREALHLRAGEMGSVHLGHGTIVNGYYNVITTDHYRLGFQGHMDQPKFSAEAMVNDLTSPNLVGLRGQWRPSTLYDEKSQRRRVSIGASVVGDFTAPTRLATRGDEPAVAGPDLRPLVDAQVATFIYGADIEWEALRRPRWSLTPYADSNHHSRVGSGLHLGLLIERDLGDSLSVSSRLEYRMLMGRYIPDYFDPLYEITRYQHPAFDEPGLAGPKLTAAASMESRTRHGGFGQVQARFRDLLTVAAAFSDATGPTGADIRLRASLDYEDRARFGVFYYQFVPGERRFVDSLQELLDPDGALVAAEGRVVLVGPLYAQGQLARQWRLGEDAHFENIDLWNLGLGAGWAF